MQSLADPHPHWLFDNSDIPDPLGYGQRAVDFVLAHYHPKSSHPRRKFQLSRWLERLIRGIYGPRDANGNRIIKRVVIMLPRGARKTSLGAILALLHLYGPEGVNNGQVILAAYDRDQARIAYEEALGIILQTPVVKKRTRVRDSRHIIKHPASGSILKAVSSDANAQNGRTPNFVLIDEIHAWKKPDLYKVLRSGLSKTAGTLEVVISQAGRGQGNIAFEVFGYARRVATGEVADPGTLPILLETAGDADWRDEANWHRVNPGLAEGFPDIDALRQEAREAEHNPVLRDTFKNDHLNMWLGHSRSPLFDMATFDLGKFDIDFAELKDLPCFLGVDLSRTGDLSAIVTAWLHDDGNVTVRPTFFLPEEDLQARADRDQAPYGRWADEHLLNVVPGPVIEDTHVEAEIRNIVAANDNVMEVAIDPHMAGPMLRRLVADGIPAFSLKQSPLLMGIAAADLSRTVSARRIRHDGHPILRAHLDHVMTRFGTTGLPFMQKDKETDRIDGAIAAAMAVSRAVANDNAGPQYTDELLELYR
ncbi:terminase TerL endonuclease subunit [Devosia sp. Leaf64]|uniref:terminase large subunit n=1 Tax=Devosia sp. Leaf64 TaxID=1736229 RepID=UPI001FCCDFDD|nr:terminase TerL endonuclease subunit [Devosia sp. Leaf64]